MLDAPDRDRAHRPEDRQKHEARRIRGGIAEIDADAERARRDRREDADPDAAEYSHKDHGRKIRREEHIGADHSEPPPPRRCEGKTEDRKGDAERQYWLGNS